MVQVDTGHKWGERIRCPRMFPRLSSLEWSALNGLTAIMIKMALIGGTVGIIFIVRGAMMHKSLSAPRAERLLKGWCLIRCQTLGFIGNMKKLGSQTRATLAESGMKLVNRPCPGVVILRPKDGIGPDEVWYANNHHAGYTIQVGRWGYEYGRDCENKPSY